MIDQAVIRQQEASSGLTIGHHSSGSKTRMLAVAPPSAAARCANSMR
jgi:hypothetical protein